MLKFSLILCLGLGLILSCGSCKKSLVQSDSIRAAKAEGFMDNLQKGGYLASSAPSRGGRVADAYAFMDSLCIFAAQEQLLKWSKEPNPVGYLAAFRCLVNADHPNSIRALESMINRRDTINYLHGDIMMQMPALQYAYTYVLYYPVPGEPEVSEIQGKLPPIALDESLHTLIIQKLQRLPTE